MTSPSKPPPSPEDSLPVIVIPKDRAVFRLDANGRWHNAHGRFEKKRIIDYFHQAIDFDADGYFVSQIKGDALEKVYFPYEDTALFVFDLSLTDPVELTLNTGRRLALDPAGLWIEDDHLYLSDHGHRIRFTDRALMKISRLMEEQGDGLAIRVGKACFPIGEKDPPAPG